MINYRIVNRVHIVAGVSGGVRVHPAALVDRQAIQIDRQGGLSKEPNCAVPAKSSGGNWWWD